LFVSAAPRNSKHSFGKVWDIREREEDVFRIRSVLQDQAVAQIGPVVRHGLAANIGNARHVSH
jgi:hypothetical protein